MAQEVTVATSLTPNIVMHIFSCLEIEGSFYHSNYGLKHHFTILDEEREKWEDFSKKCMTLGCNSELFAVLFQIPSYIPTDDIEMVLNSYDTILQAIEEGSIEVLIEGYPEVFDYLPVYAPMSVFEAHFKKLNEHKELISALIESFKELLLGLWERFYEEYWTKELKVKLEKRIKMLNDIIKPINIISTWQKTLNLKFPYPEFTAYLVEATTTIATDLLAEKIMIAFDIEDKDLYWIIIHELGRSFLLNTNIFENDHLKSIAQSNPDRLSLIVDAVCVHFKIALAAKFKIRAESDPYDIPEIKKIIQIFEKVWDSQQEKDIYKAIVETYNKYSPIV
ncbi:MAG: hypothetical protein FK734_15750 [Asgard group archaeon]|nr:hypothetical protein [Asgard group archaeon]